MSDQIGSLPKTSLFWITIKIKFKNIIMLIKPHTIWLSPLFQQTCKVSMYSQRSVHTGWNRLFFLILQSLVLWPCYAQKWADQLPHVLDLHLATWLSFVCDVCKGFKCTCEVWPGLSKSCDPPWEEHALGTLSLLAWAPEGLVGESWTWPEFWHQVQLTHKPELK